MSNGYAEGYENGYADGEAAEYELHKLKVWHKMPDKEGWYCFKGVLYPNTVWQTEVETVCDICNDIDDGITMHVFEDTIYEDGSTGDVTGEWRGPIPNPFEEQDDTQ